MTRMAVILHERLGTWSAQLRPRLQGRPVHWIETRSAADLDKALLGLACPVVLIDLKRNVVKGLSDLDRLMASFPGHECWCSIRRLMMGSRSWPASWGQLT